MNTMVSAASLATATAVVAPPTAAAASTTHAVSFPNLVDRFVRIRERWSAQQEKDRAWIDGANRLVAEAPAGLAPEELRKMYYEYPDNEPCDEDGCSVAWNEINPELISVAKAMLRRKPRSIVDLAWQTEALLTADDELLDTNPEHPMLPRLLENIRTLAGPLLIPSSIIPAAETIDPIFAAIEQHRQAVTALKECIQYECDLEELLPHDKRRSCITVLEENIVETDDPRWISAERATMKSSDAMDEAACPLVDVEPTTIAGVAALLSYFADVEARESGMFPDSLFEADEEKGMPFSCLIACNANNALGRLSGAMEGA